ncbi:MAG: V-type ATP synthase subunit D [Halieaceae bacterium]|jgi:V/A-type H+-transporting ATPase subunit D|nr:V-type ATP synthase subunit D [Halieaceae bacterium]
MAKLALNKSSLSREKQRRSSYERYLPSLEMKQKQLLAERKKAQQILAEHETRIESVEADIARRLPMLTVQSIDLTDLVRVEDVHLDEENLLGTKLPRLQAVSCVVAEFGLLARPHWFDDTAMALQEVVRLKLERQVMRIRVARLEAAARTITQRVNLFSKVLIPEATENIKRIGLFLSDQERAGVVRSKLAKQKNRKVQQ